MTQQRPKNLDLTRIRLPLPGLVSILHRISGALLFLLIPFVLYLLGASLGSAEGFARCAAVVGHPLGKLVLLALLWGLLHHFFAGLRFLALDIHWGASLGAARNSSWAVLILSLALTVALGVRLW